MRKVYISGILFLALLCVMAPAVAKVHTFEANNGDSGYQGMVVIDENGNIAFTIVAAVNGDYAATQTTSPDVEAEQQATADGQAVFAGSGAANTDGDYASTGDMAMGGGSIVTDQGAEASTFGAAAGQEDTTVSGEMALAGSNAGGDDGQYAEAVTYVDDGSIAVEVQGANDYFDVEAGQIVSASGEEIFIGSTASDGASNANAVTEVSSDAGTGTAQVNQGAEASFFGAEANQDATAAGDEVFIASSTSGFSSADAITSVIGADDPVVVVGQEAEVNFFMAEAEQESVNASGAEVCISTSAEKDGKAAGSRTEVTNGEADVRDQEAEVFLFGGAEAGQTVGAVGDYIHFDTYVSTEFGSSANTCTEVINGMAGGEQEAEWFFGAEANQDMMANAEAAELTTVATNGGDEAGTHAEMTDGFVIALQEAEAALFEGASAEQNTFIVGSSGGADSWANAADDNSAYTFINFGGYDEDDSTSGMLNTNQYAEATGDAYAYQGTVDESENFVTVVNGHAAAGSGASSDDGDCADTIAEVFYGGDITTDQWAGAGEVYFNPPGPIVGIGADGAAAGQLTEIFATHGGSVESSASSCDESEAGTEAEFHGVGNISTGQGAAAGDVWVFGEGRADGAIAAQWTDMDSTRGGEAESWSNNEDPAFATTEVGYHGDGGIEDTIQGAAAGDVRIFGDGQVEGAIAIQHTENVWSENAPTTVWASSFARNDESSAGTRAYAYGDGSISETTQGAIAGEGRIYDLGMEVEGAAAGQYTESILSDIGGGAETWANTWDPASASTEAGFHGNGGIEDTIQVAGAGEVEIRHGGEVEGAIAIQDTETIWSEGSAQTVWASSEARNDRENFAGTRVYALGDGTIRDTTQGAVAGEGLLYRPEIEVEGAAAGEFTESIESNIGGGAETWSSSRDPSSAEAEVGFRGEGVIDDSLQIAASGEAESRFFDEEGAIAFQSADSITSTDGGWASTSSEFIQRRGGTEAETEARYRDEGEIDDILQITAAGEDGAFGYQEEALISGHDPKAEVEVEQTGRHHGSEAEAEASLDGDGWIAVFGQSASMDADHDDMSAFNYVQVNGDGFGEASASVDSGRRGPGAVSELEAQDPESFVTYQTADLDDDDVSASQSGYVQSADWAELNTGAWAGSPPHAETSAGFVFGSANTFSQDASADESGASACQDVDLLGLEVHAETSVESARGDTAETEASALVVDSDDFFIAHQEADAGRHTAFAEQAAQILGSAWSVSTNAQSERGDNSYAGVEAEYSGFLLIFPVSEGNLTINQHADTEYFGGADASQNATFANRGFTFLYNTETKAGNDDLEVSVGTLFANSGTRTMTSDSFAFANDDFARAIEDKTSSKKSLTTAFAENSLDSDFESDYDYTNSARATASHFFVDADVD